MKPFLTIHELKKDYWRWKCSRRPLELWHNRRLQQLGLGIASRTRTCTPSRMVSLMKSAVVVSEWFIGYDDLNHTSISRTHHACMCMFQTLLARSQGKLPQPDGEEVAVKRLTTTTDNNNPKQPAGDDDDEQFEKELGAVRSIQHENIVEFVGYCNGYTPSSTVLPDGRPVYRKIRALCFKYMEKGSLRKHVAGVWSFNRSAPSMLLIILYTICL